MKLKKSITAMTLAASSSAFALMAPPVATKTICLNLYESMEGVFFTGTCDQAENNELKQRPLLANGCAKGQTAMTATKWDVDGDFRPNIYPCLPPNVAQL